MCITNPLKISDFQGNLLHMLLFSQKHAFYFSILRIKEGLSHVQQPLFWCTIPIQKRTKYFFEGDRASALLVVEIHHDAVIEQIDGFNKTVDGLFLKGDIRRVAVAELIEPEQNLFSCDGRRFDLFLQDAGFQLFTLLFQFLHPRLGGRRQDALLDGRHQIVDAPLHLFQFCLQNRQAGVFLALVFQQLVRQQVDDPVIQHLFQCAVLTTNCSSGSLRTGFRLQASLPLRLRVPHL